MSGPFGSSQWMYQSARDFYEFPIEQSLKFNDDDSSYLSWTPASAGNRKTFTFSAWVKRGNITTSGSFPRIFSAGDSNLYNGFFVAWTDNDLLAIGTNDPSGIEYGRQTSAVYRDTSAWYHIVAVCDTTEATLTDRLRLYVNGSRADTANLSGFGTSLPQNSDTVVSNTVEHDIGARHAFYSDNYLDGYLAEVNFIDGQALDPTSFGEFKSGVWIPKDPSGLTYGTNGFRLSFQNDTVSEGFNTVIYTGDASSRAINGLGLAPDLVWVKNRSGAYHHGLFDSVRGANKVLKSSDTSAEGTFTQQLMSFNSDGFSLGDNSDGGNYANISGNNYVAWCWDAGSENNWAADFDGTDDDVTGTLSSGIGTGDFTLEYWVRHDTLTDYQTHFSITRGSTGFNVGTDASGDMVFYSNSARQLETIGAISTGTWYHWAFVRSSGTLKSYLNGVEQDSVANTENFSATAFSIGALDSGSEFANCRISNLRLTNTAVYTANFTPPTSNLTAISGTILLTLQDGTFKDNSGSNSTVSGNNGVFLAENNQNSENTSGSITSTVKANTAYGMSIIAWAGNSTSGATIGHGLSSTPEMFIVKVRNRVEGWVVGHTDIGWSNFLQLNNTNASASSAFPWNNTAPTSSVISLGSGTGTNGSGYNYVGYAFHSVTGYSKVGSYSGSGASGNTITTGFKTAFVMIKRTDTTGNWIIFDNTRDTAKLSDAYLYPSSSDAEGTSATKGVEFTDTGFILQNDYNDANASGATYIYYAVADTRDNAFWRDQSGNGNDWQPNNLTYQDSLPDSTTNNFCTLNPLDTYGGAWTLSEGNLKGASSAVNGCRRSTMSVSSGKYYWEVYIADSLNYHVVGVSDQTCNGWATTPVGGSATGVGWFYAGRSTTPVSTDVNANTSANYGSSLTLGDIVGVALDMDAGTIEFYKNGVSQGVAYSNLSGYTLSPTMAQSSGSVMTDYYNFGQDSSFAGNKPAQGNTDDNGIGDFYYAPPSGYLALCTANLPDPVIDPAQDDVPADYFNVSLWSGNGGTQAITGLGFKPDLLWLKGRSTAYDHQLQDVIRGAGKELQSNATNSEQSYGLVSSFDTDGFTVFTDGTYLASNNSGDTYVGWSWLAGNGTSSNTSGSISSTVSVNQKAGFSIVSYTGNGTAGATVGHSLGAVPDVLLVKRRNVSNDWQVYHSANTSAPETDYLILNQSLATIDTTATWNDTAPTSSVFTVGSGLGVNNSGDTYICYAFAAVEGYSRFGSYVGNGVSGNGPFVYCGFRPSWIMWKKTSDVMAWNMHDTTRNPYNVSDRYFYANDAGAERGPDPEIDILSNGFKLRTTDTIYVNSNGGSYIFMAFAENPFKYANAR